MIFKINEENFSEFYGIQFHGAQQRRKYLLHVEAKIKGISNRNERKRLVLFFFDFF
jgi:hypothetical protein